ncbi:MAG TPA: hypothetical protein VFK32_08590 [Tepidiformaceae bacterium]|nr:hypothetical protein [Tepidiformaceae bacterium]
MDAPADSALLASARTGDAEAFAALLSRHLPAAYDFAFRTAGEAVARAAINDSCSRAALALRPLGDSENAQSWLLGLTYDALLPRLDGVSPAIPGIAAHHYAVLDLHFRQGLDVRELAAALRISQPSASITLNRLSAIHPDPGPVLRAIPRVALPPGLLDEALALALARWPVVDPVEPRPGDSLPAISPAPARTPRGRRRLIAIPLLVGTALSTAVGGLLLLPASPLAITGGSSVAPAGVAPDDSISVTPARSRTPSSPTVRAATATRSSTPVPSTATPGGTALPVGIPSSTPSTPAPTATAPIEPTGSPLPSSSPAGPTPTPTICPPALVPSVATLPVVFAPASAPSASNTVRIQNNGCSAGSFTASFDLGGAYLTLSPASATVPAFGFVDLTLVASGADFPFPFEGTVGGRVRITTPTGQAFVNLTVTRVGSSPSIAAATVCTRDVEGGVAHEFAVIASDDFALATVTVSYIASEPGTAPLTESGGQWVSTVVLPISATNFAAQARDAGGLTSNPFVFSATACG